MKHKKILAIALFAVFAMSLPMVGLAQGQSALHRKDKAELVEDAEVEVKEARTKGNEKSAEARVAACEKRQESIQKKTEKYVDNAGKYLGVVDKLSDRVQSFYDDGQLTALNYEELAKAVETARGNAEASVNTLGELDEDVDCENPDAAKNVSAFRGGAAQTRALLHEYSTSVKNLISAMQSANSNANRNGEPSEGTEDGPEGEQVDDDEAEYEDGVELETEKDGDDDSDTPDVPPPSVEEGL